MRESRLSKRLTYGPQGREACEGPAGGMLQEGRERRGMEERGMTEIELKERTEGKNLKIGDEGERID